MNGVAALSENDHDFQSERKVKLSPMGYRTSGDGDRFQRRRIRIEDCARQKKKKAIRICDNQIYIVLNTSPFHF